MSTPTIEQLQRELAQALEDRSNYMGEAIGWASKWMDHDAQLAAALSLVEKKQEALQAIADESQQHGEYNSVSGVTRLPQGYTKIMNMACDALALPADQPKQEGETK